MATRPKFAKMAYYSCECVEASHIFLKKAIGECERMYRVRPKMANFWRVLKFDKFAGEWPLLNFHALNHVVMSCLKYDKNDFFERFILPSIVKAAIENEDAFKR
jgi:hypothetical protein